jgi:hypothetical protein
MVKLQKGERGASGGAKVPCRTGFSGAGWRYHIIEVLTETAWWFH